MCGTGGADLFNSTMMSPVKISEESFNVIGIAQSENVFYFAGNNGKIGKLIRN